MQTASDVKVNSGSVESKYIFGPEIGTGGFSIVYEVTSKETGEKFACKSIKVSAAPLTPVEATYQEETSGPRNRYHEGV